MTRFRYWTNAPFLVASGAYLLNRWVVKPRVHLSFFHSYFNDLWLIPCALPPILWLHRQLGLRSHDRVPQISEIFFHLIFWSLFMEWLGPRFIPRATGDPWDALAYAVGALGAGLWWHRDRMVRLPRTDGCP